MLEKGTDVCAQNKVSPFSAIPRLFPELFRIPSLKNGETALHYACLVSNRRSVDLLLRRGADPNTPARNGSCPLHYAVQAKSVDIVRKLLQFGANVDVKVCILSFHGTCIVGVVSVFVDP